ncbi:hypothetical protein ACLKA7_013276 [Drosophila subpalustris]
MRGEGEGESPQGMHVTLNYGCCEANNDDNDVDVDVDEDDWKAVASYYNTSSLASESARMPCHGRQDA